MATIATGLLLLNGSLLSLDGQSEVSVGAATAIPGAVVVGNGGTLSGSGTIAGDVVLQGGQFVAGSALSPLVLTGALSGTASSVLVSTNLSISSAPGFAGSIQLSGNYGEIPKLSIGQGGLPNGTIYINHGTVDLRDIGWTATLARSYDSATGLLMIGGDTLHKGLNIYLPETLTAGNFGMLPDGSGGTAVFITHSGTWEASGGTPGGLWSDNTHWSSGGAPDSGLSVEIGAGLALDQPFAITASTASAASLSLDMGGNGTLLVTGSLAVAGGVAVNSGTLQAVNGGRITVAGTATLSSDTVLLVDASSGISLGTTLMPAAGTITIGTANITGGVLSGNVYAPGDLVLLPSSDSAGVQITGQLQTGGTIFVETPLEVGSLYGGHFAVEPGTALRIDHGGAPSSRIALNNSFIDLASLPWRPKLPATVNLATGVADIGGLVINFDAISFANLQEFFVGPDGSGGTVVGQSNTISWFSSLAGASGLWSDTSHWSSGAVPNPTETAEIGQYADTPDAYTVTIGAGGAAVAQMLLTMDTGTLAIADTLNVSGEMKLETGTLAARNGASASVTYMTQTGGVFTMAGDAAQPGTAPQMNVSQGYTQDGGTLNVTGGTITLLDAQLFAVASVAAGGVLTVTSEADIFGQVSVGAGGVLSVPSYFQGGNGIVLENNAAGPSGVLQIGAGGTLLAKSLTIQEGAAFSLDAAATVVLGDGVAFPGTIAIGAGGKLGVADGQSITAPVRNDGLLAISQFSSLPPGAPVQLLGPVTGTGVIEVNAPISEFADLSQFGGTLNIWFSTVTLDHGSLGTAKIAFVEGHGAIDLISVPWFMGTYGRYHPATGTFRVGGFDVQIADPKDLASWGRVAGVRPDGHGGTELLPVAPPCYALGTHIATPDGEVPVEALRPGDLVLTLGGARTYAKPVRWAGRMHVDLRRHPDPARAAPVRIRAHALGDGMPHRDLLVSPDHGILFHGGLVHAGNLIDGHGIAQVFPDTVTYLHVELDTHAILFAEGLPAESYLDLGNRGLFDGNAGTRPLAPDLASKHWHERACAPIVADGPRLAAAQAAVRARSLFRAARLLAA